MHKKMPATTWLAWVHVFNYFTCLLDRGASLKHTVFYFSVFYSYRTLPFFTVYVLPL